jgi:cysteinyl-tRNA synthetase
MLKEANDWVFWARKLDLRALGESKVDVCVVDPAVEGRELTRAEVEGLKWSPGGLKTVLAVLPIGEISEDRPHWKKEWAAAKPDWLGPAERTGRMKVRYWDERWQKTITDALDRILEQGFDGVVIEGLDAWSYWQEKDKDLRCRPRMVDWVAKVSARGKVKNKAFAILPREGEDLLAEAAFAGAVDGMIRTDLYFRRGGPVRSADVSDSQEALDKLTAAGKKVLLLEFPPDAAAVDWLYERCAAKGYVPYAGVRDLDRLVTHPAHLPD